MCRQYVVLVLIMATSSALFLALKGRYFVIAVLVLSVGVWFILLSVLRGVKKAANLSTASRPSRRSFPFWCSSSSRSCAGGCQTTANFTGGDGNYWNSLFEQTRARCSSRFSCSCYQEAPASIHDGSRKRIGRQPGHRDQVPVGAGGFHVWSRCVPGIAAKTSWVGRRSADKAAVLESW